MKKLKWWTKVLLWVGGLFVALMILGAIVGKDTTPTAETATLQERALRVAGEIGTLQEKVEQQANEAVALQKEAQKQAAEIVALQGKLQKQVAETVASQEKAREQAAQTTALREKVQQRAAEIIALQEKLQKQAAETKALEERAENQAAATGEPADIPDSQAVVEPTVSKGDQDRITVALITGEEIETKKGTPVAKPPKTGTSEITQKDLSEDRRKHIFLEREQAVEKATDGLRNASPMLTADSLPVGYEFILSEKTPLCPKFTADATFEDTGRIRPIYSGRKIRVLQVRMDGSTPWYYVKVSWQGSDEETTGWVNSIALTGQVATYWWEEQKKREKHRCQRESEVDQQIIAKYGLTQRQLKEIVSEGERERWVSSPGQSEPAAADSKAAPPARFDATVLRVVDFCTIEVKLDDGKVETVRLLGIDVAKPGPIQAARAEKVLKDELMEGGVRAGMRRYPYFKRVALVFDPKCPRRDETGRLLAHAYYLDRVIYDLVEHLKGGAQGHWESPQKSGLNTIQSLLLQDGLVRFQTKYHLSEKMTKQYKDDEKISQEQ